MRNERLARTTLGAAAVALTCVFASSAIASSEDATTFQINPSRSGSVDFIAGFSAPLVKLWTYDTGGAVGYPLIAKQTLYVVSNGNDVFAIDLASGAKSWEHLLGGSNNEGAYDGGSLFFENSQGQVIALKARNGRQLWSATVSSDFQSSSPIALNGAAYVAGPALTALDEKTGAIDWVQGIEATSSSVAYGDNGFFVGGPCQYYKYAVDGSLLWHDAGGCEGGGGILVSYSHNRAYLVDWAEGNFVLKSSDGSSAGSFPGSVPPAFFAGGRHGYELVITSGKLYCLDAKTNNVIWSFANNQLGGEPIVVNGQPIVAAGTSVYMLDGATGTQLWTDNVGAQITSLTAGDGVLAVTTGNKAIVYVPQ